MAEAIPFGQPMMPDHHSYGRDMSYRRRMSRTYDRAFTGMAEAERADRPRARRPRPTQSHRESIPATLRRIEKLEADLRRVQRDLAGRMDWVDDGNGGYDYKLVTPGERYRAQLERRAAALTEQLGYWRDHVKAAEDSGVKVWRPADFKRDDFALCRGIWYQVQRVNAKSITVMWGTNLGQLPAVTRDNVRHALGPSDRTGTISYDDIRDRKSAAEMAEILAAADAEAATSTSALPRNAGGAFKGRGEHARTDREEQGQMATVEPVRGGWAVRFENGDRTEAMNKRAALAHLDFVRRTRADLADFDARRAARIAALLASRGIGEVDYRELQPGDLFTWRPRGLAQGGHRS